ncbi:Leucine rich repeat [Klebsormidium nitens]|uniref:Leucine rich repeat n=1 Tax=Klebsormidium nitens TaxID=105231 RepID=A0A1Y1I5Z3_KLENI|nr:Leucine rich repeat [Klebsormidium nitens]|eukprot:GAQ86375.1 Leucine rich repeat [Klebsormidium nitens]
MEFFSRLTPFEERVWEVIEGALALGGKFSLQVSRATGAAAAGACEALFSPLCESAPLSQSSPLSSSQDVEALANSALSQEQHTCEATSETQGPEQTQDTSSGLVPEFSSLAFGLACCASQSAAPSSSQDGDLTSARSPPLLTHTFSSGEASQMRGLEQTHDGLDESVPALEKDELLCSQLLASAELPTQLCERGLCGATEGALPGGRDRVSEGEEGAGSGRSQSLLLAEPSLGACHFERLDRGCVYEILRKFTNTHLKDCSLVCREWLEISNEVRYTMRLERAPQTAALPALVSRFLQLNWLRIWDEAAAACTNDVFVHDVACLSQLRLLHVRGCGDLSDAGLAAVLRGCPELHTLILEQCGGFSGRAFEGVHCGKLEVLDLEGCGALNNMGLCDVAEACPGLVHLTLKRESDKIPLAVGLKYIAEGCTGLRELVLHACGLTDKTLLAFAVAEEESLEILQFSGCSLLTDATIESVAI